MFVAPGPPLLVDPTPTVAASMALRLFGVAFSVFLLYRVGDGRFAVLTLLFSLMTLRQWFTALGVSPAFAELPGLGVSVLSVGVVYGLLRYTRQEAAVKAELRETNRRLRDHRTRLEAIVSASPDDVFVVDEDGRYAETFPGGAAGPDDVRAGRRVHEVRPDDVVDLVEETRHAGRGGRLEYSLPGGDESRRYEARTARIESLEGADSVLFVRRDVTERWKRDRRLRRLRRAVEAAGAGIYITDRDGTIQYVNPAFEEITGYDESTAVGATPRLFSSGIHDDDYYERLWSTILAGETWRETITNERRSGERYHAKQTVAPVVDDDGDIVEFVAIQIDVTQREHRTRQLTVLDRLLRHNLRNDLTVVMGHAARIEDECDGAVAESAALIHERGASLLANAEKERTAVRLVTEDQTRHRVDVAAVCRDRVAATRRAWPDARIDLDAPETAPVAAVDELGQAIEELIENAVEHSDRSTRVTVTVEAGPETVVRVADDGPGIPEQERRVFEDAAPVGAVTHGSGVGLWLVYWAVRLSGGTVAVADGDPVGSVVTLTLDGAGAPAA
jgi:PAS domain S-box-containing protein